jgi:predicted nucleotidyltransferase
LTHQLWATEIGSHLWKMNHPGSDHDMFSCYAAETVDILSGAVEPGGCHVSKDTIPGTDETVDIQSHEVQRWVDGVRNGNVNYVVGVLSDIVYPFLCEGGWLGQLRTVLMENPSRALVPSTLGLARSSIHKSHNRANAEDSRRARKNLRTAMRTLRFTTTFLRDAVYKFEPVTDMSDDMSLADMERMVRDAMLALEELDERMSVSLPRLSSAVPFQNFLLRLRLAMLKEEWQGPSEVEP